MNECNQYIDAKNAKSYVRELDGSMKLQARISPCVFMYKNHALQVEVALMRDDGTSLGSAYAENPDTTAQKATDADVRRLLDAVRIVACHRCSAPAFDPSTIQTNRAGLCESCFRNDLKVDLAKAEEAERKIIAARDRARKKSGDTVRITARVHPANGGDDYQVDWYCKSYPSPEHVRSLLLQMNSRVCDDYQIIKL
ncbi:MAG: hypothetical protein WKF77_03930 [Planctomycetaceae bacterium]